MICQLVAIRADFLVSVDHELVDMASILDIFRTVLLVNKMASSEEVSSAIVEPVVLASSNGWSSRRETAQRTRYGYGEHRLPRLTDGPTRPIPSQWCTRRRSDEGPDADAPSLSQAPTVSKDVEWMRGICV
jgi:hypothetical protein